MLYLSAAGETPLPPLFDLDKAVNDALQQIYNDQGGIGDISEELFRINAEFLTYAATSTFAQMGVEFGQTYAGFIDEFRHNCDVFAAFKTHEEQEALAALLLDDNGALRSFHEFRKASVEVVGNYNRRWLLTEYNTAVRSARMAANWKKFEENADIFPNIEFMLSRAANKRESHKTDYVGTILPITDPWWDTHTPPLAWGCQCWIRQTRAPSTRIAFEPDPIDPAFQNNPGKTAQFVRVDATSYAINATDATRVAVDKKFNNK